MTNSSRSSRAKNKWWRVFVDNGTFVSVIIQAAGFVFFTAYAWIIGPVEVLTVTFGGVVCGFLIVWFRPRNRLWFTLLQLSTVAFAIWMVGLQDFPSWRALSINWLYSVGVGFTIAYLLERRRDRGGKGVAPADRANYVLVPDGTRVRRLPLGEFVGLVRGLDGQKRSLVSAVRRGARLDVVGDASGAMVVWFSPDVKDEDVWSVLASPVAGTVFRLPPGEGEELVRVSVDGVEGEYARWETTTLTSAVGAAEQFVKDGTAKEGLVWFASPDVFERRPLR